MNRRTLIIVFGLALRAGAFLAVILPHRRPEPPKAVTNAKTPAPPPPHDQALCVFHRDVEKARDRLKKGDPPARDSRAVF